MSIVGFAWVLTVSLAATAQQTTDFGIRTVPGTFAVSATPRETPATAAADGIKKPFDVASAANLGSQWGRVTSTRRTASRNRAVGGVRNSYHLSGRAIDIARRAGVRHRQIEAAYRQAGYQLVESLDEGDHSHFAFRAGRVPIRADKVASVESAAPVKGTAWRIVYAPRN